MSIVINIVLILVLGMCVWSGFRRGLIRSISGLVVLIVALIGANLLADAYSKEIVPALNPFVSGYIDSETTTQAVLEEIGYGDSDMSLTDILEQDPSMRNDYAYGCLRYIGFYKDVAVDLSQDCVTVSDNNGVSMTEAVITVVCNTVAYVGCVTVAFLMILILLTALIELFNLEIRLPNLIVLDEVGGSVMGLIQGFLLCVLLSWLLGFMGIIIGKETADKCTLLNFFQAFRFITRSLI